MNALLVICCALVAVASAQVYHYAYPGHYVYGAPTYHGSQYRSQNNLGQYSYGYATADGSSKNEVRGADGSVSGGYSYTGADGKQVNVQYTAGQEGFRATSNVLPQPVQPTSEVAAATQQHLAAKNRAASQAASPAAVVAYGAYPYHHYAYPYHHVYQPSAYSYGYSY